MFFDLNVTVPAVSQPLAQVALKKGKGKQQIDGAASVPYNATHVNTVEARVDLLVRCEFYCSVRVPR